MTNEELETVLKQLGWNGIAITPGIEQNFKCIYCGLDFLFSIENYSTWTVDHVIPKSKNGGSDDPENIVIACLLCNLIKRAWVPCDLGQNASKKEKVDAARKHIMEGREKKKDILKPIFESVQLWRAHVRES